jgi:hypothetical protein
VHRSPSARVLIASISIALGLAAPAAAQTKVGGPGPDRLVAAASGAILLGGGGPDTLLGGPGNDSLYGGRSSNTLSGGGGNNYVEGGTGDDQITAGDGANTLYGGTGHDTISAGNGNNYVDGGGAPDTIRLGNGNNVVHGGSGGADITVGSGNNTIFAPTGTVKAGGGVNRIYISSGYITAPIDCGGNPASVLYVNTASGSDDWAMGKLRANRLMTGCSTLQLYDGPGAIRTQQAGLWEQFSLIGSDRADKLLGGHGGGLIDAKGGDNIIWADQNHETGGAQAQGKNTTILAGNGDNQIFAGRGTNVVTVGSGDNFIRGGVFRNTITTGGGNNSIRLQGKSTNVITLNGGASYVESFINGTVQVTCQAGASAAIVYSRSKPKTNCGKVVNAKTKAGERMQLLGTIRIPASDAIVDAPPLPGDGGVGVPRPAQVG